MKRIVIATALLLASVLAAQARWEVKYYDLIRPNGHKRSDAVFRSNSDFCYRQTGQSRYVLDGPAFRKCMLSRGYRFMWQRQIPDPPSSCAHCGPDPQSIVTAPDEPPAAPYVPPAPPVFDPTTGMPVPGTGQ